MRRAVLVASTPDTKIQDEDLEMLFEYEYFYKRFGLTMKEVDSLDPKIVQKLRIYENIVRSSQER